MKKLLNWLIDKWLAGFITTLGFFLLKAYIDLPPEKKVNFFKFSWIGSILKLEIKLWQVLIVIVFIIGMFTITKRLRKAPKEPQNKLTEPPSYRIDVFGVSDSKWTWDYQYNAQSKQYNVANLAPVCPECDSPMGLNEITQTATCSRCRLEGKRSTQSIRQLKRDIEIEIIRRYSSGEWKNSKLK
jgi:hypothetical protein